MEKEQDFTICSLHVCFFILGINSECKNEQIIRTIFNNKKRFDVTRLRGIVIRSSAQSLESQAD